MQNSAKKYLLLQYKLLTNYLKKKKKNTKLLQYSLCLKISVFTLYWYRSNYVKGVISVLKNVNFKEKWSLNVQKRSPALSLHRLDLKVSLKISDTSMSYHFTRILVEKGSHLCETKLQKEVRNSRVTKSSYAKWCHTSSY